MSKKTDADKLGNIIRKRRKEQNMTQAELAARAVLNESYLSAVECGYSYISVAKYMSICDGLGADPLEIMKEFVEARAEDEAADKPAEASARDITGKSEKASEKGNISERSAGRSKIKEPEWFLDN